LYALEVNGTSTYDLGKAGVAVILLKRIISVFEEIIDSVAKKKNN